MGESETPKKPSFAPRGNGNNNTKRSDTDDGFEQMESLEIFEETEIEEVIQVPRGPKWMGHVEA